MSFARDCFLHNEALDARLVKLWLRVGNGSSRMQKSKCQILFSMKKNDLLFFSRV